MIFDEALKHLKNNFKVKRTHWCFAEDAYVELLAVNTVENKSYLTNREFYIRFANNINNKPDKFTMTFQDIIADDWEIVK